MIILTERLTTGQVTFILRVVVQVLGYVGLFLIGLIILGHTPRIAPLETHDVMNRIVGKSTATTSTLHWIRRRITGRSRDPTPSTFLLFALVLSLLYGLFVSLSDVGFIGLQQCDIAGAAVRDFPGSVQSEADALSIVQDNMLNGTDPASVNSYRCDSSVETRFDEKVTELVCTKWVNSTSL